MYSNTERASLSTAGNELKFESWFDPHAVAPHAPAGGVGAGLSGVGKQLGVIGDAVATMMGGGGAGGAPPGPSQQPWSGAAATTGHAFYVIEEMASFVYVQLFYALYIHAGD